MSSGSWSCWYKPIIPATQETEMGRIMIQDQYSHKVSKIPSQETSQVWWLTSVIPDLQEAYIGDPRSIPGKKHKTPSKN
jgi:hypothetical protein